MLPQTYSFWDIILVHVPYSDGSNSKPRTAIILYEDRQDCLVIKMTSNLNQENKYTMTVLPDEENGLREVTVIEIWKQFLLQKTLIIAHIGRLSAEHQKELRSKIHIFIDSI